MNERSRLAIFTICSNNYISAAKTLLKSAKTHHPNAELFLCLADKKLDQDIYGSGWTVIEAESLGIPDFPAFSFKYDVMAMNMALKPIMFQHLFQGNDYDAVLYFDADIKIFRPLTDIVDTLRQGASFVLTPHICCPAEDSREPNDFTILRSGVYNAGFLGVANNSEAKEAIDWWARHLRFNCLLAQERGIFYDQRFLDLIPSFAPRCRISHDTSLNVAYWNLDQRVLQYTETNCLVDGRTLGFFHFSGFNLKSPSRLSKYRHSVHELSKHAIRRLIKEYIADLRFNGYVETHRLPYAYGVFASGKIISNDVRNVFRAHEVSWNGDPFSHFEAVLENLGPNLESEKSVGTLRRELEGVYASTSWRVTAPLRKIADYLRGRQN